MARLLTLRSLFTTATLLAALGASALSHAATKVKLETSAGDIILELDETKAPKTVENFLGYVDSGFYDGTIFHRVINNFMIQGGGFTADFVRKPTRDPVENEAANGLKNVKYSISMARTSAPHSATAQFFINNTDNGFLDYRSATPRGWGYAVFGRVIEGSDVVDQISATQTGRGGPFPKDVPQETITIKRALRVAE